MKNKIILNLAISLDGFIADSRGDYDFIVPSGDSALNTQNRWSHQSFVESISAVVMGKKCYDQQLHMEYQHKQVYVVSSKPIEEHDNIKCIGGRGHLSDAALCAEVLRIRDTADGDIYLFGGGLCIDPLLKAGLIDAYIIGIIPIILGSGIPLFLQNNKTIPLTLTQSYVEDGIVILCYAPRSEP